jgi:hypothetical protein
VVKEAEVAFWLAVTIVTKTASVTGCGKLKEEVGFLFMISFRLTRILHLYQ